MEEDSEFEVDEDGNKIEMDFEQKLLKRKKKKEEKEKYQMNDEEIQLSEGLLYTD